MTINKRRITEQDIAKYHTGKTYLVELDMPSSKYHGSIFRTQIYNEYRNWYFHLDAPELPRRLNVHFTYLLKTKETKERLTNPPTIKEDIVFKDFSGQKIEVGDVLFGEGKLIRITEVKSTLCIVKCLHPTSRWKQVTFRYREGSIKKYLHIKDPTMILLKI